MNNDYITTRACDSCYVEGPVVMIHDHNGTPVYTQCALCGPRSFESIARRDIDSWLCGEDTFDPDPR